MFVLCDYLFDEILYVCDVLFDFYCWLFVVVGVVCVYCGVECCVVFCFVYYWIVVDFDLFDVVVWLLYVYG